MITNLGSALVAVSLLATIALVAPLTCAAAGAAQFPVRLDDDGHQIPYPDRREDPYDKDRYGPGGVTPNPHGPNPHGEDPHGRDPHDEVHPGADRDRYMRNWP